MKLYKYSLIAALALSGVLSACDDNDYAPGAPVAGDQVYFSLDESDEVSIPEQATSVTINVNRVKTDNALTVDFTYTLTDASGAPVTDIFTVPASASFAEGSETAPIEIGVDFSKVVADAEYFLTLELKGNNLTPYGASKREYVLSYAPWSEWEYVPGEVGTYTFTQLSSIKGDYDVYVVTRHSLVNPDNVQYATVGPFTNGINFVYSMNLSETIEIDGVECPLVTMQSYYSPLNVNQTEYVFWWLDVRYWIAEFWGLGWDNVDRVMELNDLPVSHFNPVTGLFSVDVAVVDDDPTTAGTSGAYGVGYEYLQLPGYKNYQVSFDYTGNYVDGKGTEYAIVNAYKSDDVASYIADVFAGDLDETEIEAAIEVIKSNEDLPSITASTTNLAYQLQEDGDYTIVAVGRDANGVDVCKAVYNFTYSTVKANDPWETIGWCEYTDGLINSGYKLGGETWDVEVQANTENPGIYRLVNPYAEWAEAYKAAGVTYGKGNYYMIVNAQNPDQVYLEQSNLGITLTASRGELGVWSSAGYLLENGVSADIIAAQGYFGKLEDGVVTFPTGELIITFANDDRLLSGNVDFTNPTDGEAYGPGTFRIDFGSIATAPAKRVKAAGNVKTINKANAIEAEGKTKKSAVKIISAETLQDYRSQNPRQFKF